MRRKAEAGGQHQSQEQAMGCGCVQISGGCQRAALDCPHDGGAGLPLPDDVVCSADVSALAVRGCGGGLRASQRAGQWTILVLSHASWASEREHAV